MRSGCTQSYGKDHLLGIADGRIERGIGMLSVSLRFKYPYTFVFGGEGLYPKTQGL